MHTIECRKVQIRAGNSTNLYPGYMPSDPNLPQIIFLDKDTIEEYYKPVSEVVDVKLYEFPIPMESRVSVLQILMSDNESYLETVLYPSVVIQCGSEFLQVFDATYDYLSWEFVTVTQP